MDSPCDLTSANLPLGVSVIRVEVQANRRNEVGQASNANTDLAIENWLNFRVAMFLE